jgi:hypothetical protein
MNKEGAEKLIKKFLPNFEISGELGKGAFGAVYKIKDDLKERAAKIVGLDASTGIENGQVVSADNKIERDFRHIVESYERIACDEIVTVYDFYMAPGGIEGMDSAHALVIMEIYPAALDKFVIESYQETGRPLELMVAKKLIEKVATMLGNLYNKTGFLFEDFKPDNILIKEHLGDLKVVVGDIGGLKNVVSIGITGSQVTPTYAAPEVIRQGQVPDMRSIIYSYGLLCFFILEGHLPYEDQRFAARFDMLKNQGLPFERTDVPDNIHKIMLKCLAFDSNDRFASFDDVMQALKGEVQVEAPMSAPTNPFEGGTINIGPGSGAPAPAPAGGAFGEGTINIGPGSGAPVGAPIAAPVGAPVGAPPVPAPAAPVSDTEEMDSQTRAMKAPRKKNLKKMGTAKSSIENVSISDEKELISTIDKEIKGRIIRKGEVVKVNNNNFKIVGKILVEKGAVLSITNSKLFFGADAGIIVQGALRAKDSLFSAIDAAKGWSSILILSKIGVGVNVIENCRFHFGKGVSGQLLIDKCGIVRPDIKDTATYGGGMFISGGSDKTITLKNVTCYKCSAHDGGGMFIHNSTLTVESCTFEGCTAKGVGGAMTTFESPQEFNNCTFTRCSAARDGGGICLMSSNSTLGGCMFRSCISKYYGGGVACVASSPVLTNCQFDLCKTTKSGGAIFADRESGPKVTFPSYSKCKPDDTNF